MERKNLADLIEAIQTINPDSRDNIELFVRTFFNAIVKGLEKDRFVKIKGFGTFKLIDVSSRESVDVNTGNRIEISGHSKITFTPDQFVKDEVNKPFAHLQSVVINEGTDIAQMSIADGKEIENIRLELENGKDRQENPGKVDEAIKSDVNVEETNGMETVKAANAGTANSSETENYSDEDEEKTDDTKETDSAELETEIDTDYDTTDCNTTVEEEEEENETFEVPEPSTIRKKHAILWVVASAVVFFMAGTFIGSFFLPGAFNDTGQKSNQPKVVQVPDKAKAKSQNAQKDTGKVSPENSIRKPTEEEKPKKEIKPIMPIMQGDKYIITGQKGTHVLKAGENVTRLAKQIYGSKDCAKYIVRFNNISDPDLIPIGTILKLPELNFNDRGN